MNGYAYIFGRADSKAFALLGLIGSLILVVYPVLAGLIGYFVGRVISRDEQRGNFNGMSYQPNPAFKRDSPRSGRAR